MEKLIIKYLRMRYNIKIVLRNKIVRDILDILYLDFLDDNGQYFSFFIPFNSNIIFADKPLLLGTADFDIGFLVDENVRIFNTKNEWFNGRYSESVSTIFIEFIKSQMNLFLESLKYSEYENYRLFSAELNLKPVISLILYYEKENCYMTPITLTVDCMTYVNEELFRYLEYLNIPNSFRYCLEE